MYIYIYTYIHIYIYTHNYIIYNIYIYTHILGFPETTKFSYSEIRPWDKRKILTESPAAVFTAAMGWGWLGESDQSRVQRAGSRICQIMHISMGYMNVSMNHLSVCLSVCLSVYLLSIVCCLPVCLSIYLSICAIHIHVISCIQVSNTGRLLN